MPTPRLFFNPLPLRPSQRPLVCLFLIIAMSLQTTKALSQQNKEAQKKQDETVRLETRLVTTDVIVKDKKGKYVMDLKAEDFTVFENGVAQKLEIFEPPLGSEAPKPKTADSPSAASSGDGQANILSLVLDGATTDQTNFKQVREGTLKYIRERITDTDAVA